MKFVIVLCLVGFMCAAAAPTPQNGAAKSQPQGNYMSVTGENGATYSVPVYNENNGFKPELEQRPGGVVPLASIASKLG